MCKEKQRKRIRIEIELGGKHQERQKGHFWIEIRKESKDYRRRKLSREPECLSLSPSDKKVIAR